MIVESGKGILAIVVYGILLAIGFKIGSKIYDTAEKEIPARFPEASKKSIDAIKSFAKGW